MRRTGPGVLLLSAIIGVAVGYLLDNGLTAAGRPTFMPTITLPILLVLLGMLTLALAIPIRRATRGVAVPVNPFRAVRVAMLAKASSIVGAAVGGVAGGLAIFLFFARPFTPSIGSLGPIIATAVGGAILVATALIAEHLCTIRKDDDDEHPGAGGDAGVSER